MHYDSQTEYIAGVKEGILLEVGFDTVTPNTLHTISSWALDRALLTIGDQLIDNKALQVACYSPGYSLVEKLQTITKKFRQEIETGEERPNLMRQYYDVYCLLGEPAVQDFIGTQEYESHKIERFRGKDNEIPIRENEAFLLSAVAQRERFKDRYIKTKALYYKEQTDFDLLLERIGQYIDRL